MYASTLYNSIKAYFSRWSFFLHIIRCLTHTTCSCHPSNLVDILLVSIDRHLRMKKCQQISNVEWAWNIHTFIHFLFSRKLLTFVTVKDRCKSVYCLRPHDYCCITMIKWLLTQWREQFIHVELPIVILWERGWATCIFNPSAKIMLRRDCYKFYYWCQKTCL